MNLKNTILRCPDCHSPVNADSLQCLNCGWVGKHVDGVLSLLPTAMDIEKINEDLIHEKVQDPVWRDLLYKKKLYFDKFEKLWMKEVITSRTENFLELGGGLCYLSALAKYHHPNTTVWASDVSPRYLCNKSRKVASILDVKVDFYAAIDAENLPFEDAQFDAILISHSIHHIGDIERMLQEVFRVLKPGGRFLGVDIASPSIKALYDKDIKERSRRGVEFGIHEKSLRYRDWGEIIRRTGIPEFTLQYEPGPKTQAQWARKIENLRRRIAIWITATKPPLHETPGRELR